MNRPSFQFCSNILKHLKLRDYKKVSMIDKYYLYVGMNYFEHYKKLKCVDVDKTIIANTLDDILKTKLIKSFNIEDLMVYEPKNIMVNFTGKFFDDINYIEGPVNLIGTFTSEKKNINQKKYCFKISCSFKNGVLDGFFKRVIKEDLYDMNFNDHNKSIIYYTNYENGKISNIDVSLHYDYIFICDFSKKNNDHHHYSYPNSYNDKNLLAKKYDKLYSINWEDKLKFINDLNKGSLPEFVRMS